MASSGLLISWAMEAARRPVTASFSLLRSASSLRLRSLASSTMTPDPAHLVRRGPHRIGADQPGPCAPASPVRACAARIPGCGPARSAAKTRNTASSRSWATGCGSSSGSVRPRWRLSATPVISAKTWLTRTKRQRRSKKARPMGALASMESSSESVSFSPARCSASEATMRLNASIRSPISLCTATGRGKLRAVFGRGHQRLRAAVQNRQRPGDGAGHDQHQQAGGGNPDDAEDGGVAADGIQLLVCPNGVAGDPRKAAQNVSRKDGVNTFGAGIVKSKAFGSVVGNERKLNALQGRKRLVRCLPVADEEHVTQGIGNSGLGNSWPVTHHPDRKADPVGPSFQQRLAGLHGQGVGFEGQPAVCARSNLLCLLAGNEDREQGQRQTLQQKQPDKHLPLNRAWPPASGREMQSLLRLADQGNERLDSLITPVWSSRSVGRCSAGSQLRCQGGGDLPPVETSILNENFIGPGAGNNYPCKIDARHIAFESFLVAHAGAGQPRRKSRPGAPKNRNRGDIR